VSYFKWYEVLSAKMLAEFYKHGNFDGPLYWVVNYTRVVWKGIWEKGVLRVLEEHDHLEVVRHWIYIIKMHVPKLEDHYTKEEWEAMQQGVTA